VTAHDILKILTIGDIGCPVASSKSSQSSQWLSERGVLRIIRILKTPPEDPQNPLNGVLRGATQLERRPHGLRSFEAGSAAERLVQVAFAEAGHAMA
jgi:hypothetical protein